MKKNICLCLAALLLCLLSASAATNDVAISGSVINIGPTDISATFGGTVSGISAHVGDHISTGDALASLSGQKVYALQDGTVHLFGAIGDSAEAVADSCGAVVYIEPADAYSVSASTKNVYEGEENKIIHPGETVYVRSLSDTKHSGTGYVTSVSGTSYSVQITQGVFSANESVYVYRSSDFVYSSRIGSGSVSHKDPVAYTAEGVISRINVKEGAQVKKGDVLFETLSGSFAGANAQPDTLVSPVDGVLASLELTRGASVAAGDTVARIYPDEYMRIEAYVYEADLEYFARGSEVTIELINLGDGKTKLGGVVEKISRIGNASESDPDEVLYSVLIVPDDTQSLSYSMTALVSLIG